MRTRFVVGPAVVMLWLAPHVFARGDGRTPSPTRQRTAVTTEAARAPMTIYGAVKSSSNAPVASARVQLRDARTGRLVGLTKSDPRGEFAFQLAEPGLYVPEMLDASGQVVAAGDMLSIDFGQTMATTIRLPMRVPVFGWFGDAAGAIASAAASAGVLAVAAAAPPATPGQ
jgi:hypothetical protein